MSDGGGSSKGPGSPSGKEKNGTHAWSAEHGDVLPRGPSRPVLGAVLEHGRRTVNLGLAIGLVITLIIHGIASVRAETALFDMLHWVHETQKDMKDYFWASYDLEPPKPDEKKEKEEPPPPEPPPPPEVKEVTPPPQTVKVDDPYKNAPPPTKIAEAAPLMTAKGDDPYDGVQTGNNANATGLQSSGGTDVHGDTHPVSQPPPAANTGAPAAPPPPKEDHSKPPTIAGGSAWNCPFPPEADADGRDSAVATIVVTVRPDGTPASVSVVADPGSGFGRAARQCALGRRYQAGLDRDGNPTTATTPPIRVRFSR